MKAFHPIGLVAILALTACAPNTYQTVTDRIEVQRAEYVHSYSFAQGATGLSDSEVQRLRNFLNRQGVTHEDRLVITIPGNAQGRGYEVRRAYMAQMIARTGAKAEFIGSKPGEVAAGKDGTGIIRVLRPTKMVVRCPSDQGLLPGCATSRNLAAMVRNPNDLVVPVGPVAPRYYHKSAPAPLPQPLMRD